MNPTEKEFRAPGGGRKLAIPDVRERLLERFLNKVSFKFNWQRVQLIIFMVNRMYSRRNPSRDGLSFFFFFQKLDYRMDD